MIRAQDVSEEVFLTKNIFGEYKVVQPKRDKDGRLLFINWMFGGWMTALAILGFLLLILLFWFVYQYDTSAMQAALADPCKFCNPEVSNFTNLNLSFG